MSKTFAIGDIHGAYKALIQCLERSKFNYNQDKLIVLGDVCDGWLYVKECFDELLKIKNLVYILGNHDEWAMDWYDREDMYRNNPYVQPEYLWTSQGGEATLKSYGIEFDEKYNKKYMEMDASHLNLLKNAKYYHVESTGYDEEQVFAHGGIPEFAQLHEYSKDFYLWDRSMLERAFNIHFINPNFKINSYKDIFIGHTTVQYFNADKIWKKEQRHIDKDSKEACLPLHVCNVWNLDTGAGWSGKLTIIDVNTYEFWQSDNVSELYPNEKERRY